MEQNAPVAERFIPLMTPDLFDYAREKLQVKQIRFDGSDYSPSSDDVRLTGQLLRVYDALKPGKWLTLKELSSITGSPEASCSSQMRHLRKERFNSHIIEKRNLGYGLWEYRMVS